MTTDFRRFTRCVASFFLIAFVVVVGMAAKRPNVVWLLSEDNSVHYLKMFDPHGIDTPRISELASHGLQYNRAFSNAPVCSVARTTLITGCFGPRIGTQFHRRSVSVPMPNGLKMFPAYLREAGYYTSNNQKKDYNANETPNTWNESSGKASWRKRAPDQPFFHMQSFATTHESSLHFTKETYESSPTKTDPKSVFVAPYHPDSPLVRYTVAKYHDQIRKMDEQIGEVVDQLAKDGLLEDTFIFYFGDHGGVLPRGKGYAYESGLHVPLVVRVPDNFQHLAPHRIGSQLNGFVQFIDFSATVLNLAGLEIPKQIDGRPFLGQGTTVQELDARQEALGYADRFDEKYDLVRTLRQGKYEYVRSYQPFNFDALQNNYRYNMLAYREWRELYRTGKLNEIQSQFFRTRPVELLFDIQADPHEVQNLANNPDFKSVLASMRKDLQSKIKSMPDLSFYPESFLVEHAFDNPTQFGEKNREEIAKLVEIADLSLLTFAEAQPQIANSLASKSATERYWGLIVCSCFGGQAVRFIEKAKELSTRDNDLLVRTRAAEFLALIAAQDPRPTIMECLRRSKSGIECCLILNSVVLLQEKTPGYRFTITPDSVGSEVRKSEEVARRLDYLAAENSPRVQP
jgi:arylsulfatase A-like enzyme